MSNKNKTQKVETVSDPQEWLEKEVKRLLGEYNRMSHRINVLKSIQLEKSSIKQV